jgi:hypothetical protein
MQVECDPAFAKLSIRTTAAMVPGDILASELCFGFGWAHIESAGSTALSA